MAKTKTKRTARGENLLVELLTEELPPKYLQSLAQAFASELTEALRAGHFLTESSEAETFATPRRLAVRISGVVAKQPDRMIERKGPSVQAGLDASGGPTQALAGFARSCGVAPDRLERRKDKKGEHFVYRAKQKGEPLTQHLAALVDQSIRKLPVARLMRWAARDVQFVRPVHGLVMLHGKKVVPGEVMGLKSGNRTRGHRFLSKGPVVIRDARDYEKALKAQGYVIASFVERRQEIASQLDRAARRYSAVWRLQRRGLVRTATPTDDTDSNASDVMAAAHWILQGNAELLDEVAAIVEWPVIYEGRFDQAFLQLPTQCIGLTMQKNQKYFPLVHTTTYNLLANYLIVGNIKGSAKTRTGQVARNVIEGNARVLRARLSDAKFFYDQDRKQRLADRVPRLAHVVYHNKLGSQLERVQRIQRLAAAIALMLNGDPVTAERAAYLCKADLVTDMVGEFPELQGLMGYYYARNDGESDEVAGAIRQHYLPRFAGDVLPRDSIARAVALADKLDTLVGIFGIGLVPTGEKDPFGLRRAAVGVLRILLEGALPLDFVDLLERARGLFEVPLGQNVDHELQEFFVDRLRSYLRERDYAADEVEAVLALNLRRFDQVIPRLKAIRKFRAAPEGQALAAANKRIQNILRQAGDGDPEKITPAIDGAAFREEAEKRLAHELREVAQRVQPLTAAGDYAGALKELSQLRGAVDTFFDSVMVMVEDEQLRTARLQLLAQIRREFREIADISKLQG
jgi:glycyl-tRNA synthetase beta chain